MSFKKFLMFFLTFSSLFVVSQCGDLSNKEKTNERRQDLLQQNSILAKVLLVIVNDAKFKEMNQWTQLEIIFNVLNQLNKIFKENGLI